MISDFIQQRIKSEKDVIETLDYLLQNYPTVVKLWNRDHFKINRDYKQEYRNRTSGKKGGTEPQ